MADADEDVMPRSGPPPDEIDLSEEIQDFRFLANATGSDAKIPKRGEKDFEPHATALQSNTLAASRQAMHNALSFQRVHAPKNWTEATYHPESNMAYAYDPKGPMFVRMGQVLSAHKDPLGEDGLRGSRMWLLPEEVLYLVERGTLDVRWPATEDDEDGKGLPMSLQGAYAMFIGDEADRGALTLERYNVYSNLKRMGYTVLRAQGWDSPGPVPGKDCYPPTIASTWRAGLFTQRSLMAFFTRQAVDTTSTGPLVADGLYRDYSEIYRRLALIPWHDPSAVSAPQPATPPTTGADHRVTFDVWKPGSQTFKKSAPGPPDFRIAVIDGRETRAPSLQQLSAIMETVPYDPPKEDGQLYQKLKHGYKSVILAIVDQGVVSYLRFADAAFGREKLYERKGRMPGGKRGGRQGGRGRGK